MSETGIIILAVLFVIAAIGIAAAMRGAGAANAATAAVQNAIRTDPTVERATFSGGYMHIERAVGIPTGLPGAAGPQDAAGAEPQDGFLYVRHTRPGGETVIQRGTPARNRGRNADADDRPAQQGPTNNIWVQGGSAHAASYPYPAQSGGQCGSQPAGHTIIHAPGYGGAPCWGGDPNLANGGMYAPASVPAPAPVRPGMGCAQSPTAVGDALAAYTVDPLTGPQPGSPQWVTLGRACAHIRGCAACQAAAAPAIAAVGGSVAELNASRLRGMFIRPAATPPVGP